MGLAIPESGDGPELKQTSVKTRTQESSATLNLIEQETAVLGAVRI